MSKRFLLASLFYCVSNILYAQSKYDYNWTIGYDTSDFDETGNVILIDFNQDTVKVNTVKTVKSFASDGSPTTMSDASGNIIFYTSGCYVVNAQHKIMLNGDSINPGYIQQYYCPFGNSPIQDGAIAIPWPDSPNHYLLFIKDYASIMFPGEPMSFNGGSPHLYYNVIDMTKDNGLGAVVLKNQVAVEDTLCPNSIEACLHANGRDWWVLVAKGHTNCFYAVLVTPDGVQTPQKICTGIPWNDKDQVGQSCFTPDGSKFIRFNDWNGIHIFDFDNEAGTLSNQRVIYIDDYETNYTGITVSPNSRYLYACMGLYLYQYDLWASDIAASRILLAVRDLDPDPFVPSGFRLAATGPDGKIYIASGSSHLSLHVIHRPDCAGQNSLLEQRGLKLTSWNYYSIPNIPFFRNEPTGTPCDSIAVATYTPVYDDQSVALFPNPAKETFHIFCNQQLPAGSIFILADALGRVVKRLVLDSPQPMYTYSTEGLGTGIYYFTIQGPEKVIRQGKLLIQK